MESKEKKKKKVKKKKRSCGISMHEYYPTEFSQQKHLLSRIKVIEAYIKTELSKSC